MKYCNPCATALTVEHNGNADIVRTGSPSTAGECERCGRRHRPVIEYDIIPASGKRQSECI